MKKVLMLIGILSSFYTTATFAASFKIEDLNIDVNSSSGVLNFQHFEGDSGQLHYILRPATYDIKNQNGTLHFSTPMFEVNYLLSKNLVENLLVQLDSFFLSGSGKKYSGQFKSLDLRLPQELSMKDVSYSLPTDFSSAECSAEDMLLCALESFTIKGSLLKFPPAEEGFVLRDERGITIDQIVNPHLVIKNSKAVLQGEIKVGFKLQLLIEANTTYSLETGVFSIEVTKAKAGAIKIFDMLFKALEESQGDFLQVKRPFIYLKLKK